MAYSSGHRDAAEWGCGGVAFRFEQLEIWKPAIAFVRQVYQATEAFPRSEVFGLRSDIRRAVRSVPMNISEGAGRGSNRDFARFIDIVRGSAYEAVTGMAVAVNLRYVTLAEYKAIYREAETLAKKLTRFQQTLTPVQKGEA